MSTQAFDPQNFYYATTPPPPPHAPLKGEVRADVCIIGGGISGLSAALHLAERGFSQETFHTFLAVTTLCALTGQMLCGWLSLRYPMPRLLAIAMFLYAVGLATPRPAVHGEGDAGSALAQPQLHVSHLADGCFAFGRREQLDPTFAGIADSEAALLEHFSMASGRRQLRGTLRRFATARGQQ